MNYLFLTLRDKFKPKPDNIKAWLSTRKSSYNIANGVVFPGLFQTSSFNKDRSWFLGAMAVELLAVIITVLGGFETGGIWILGSIGLVIAFVILDIVGAKWHHSNKAYQTYYKNKLALCSDTVLRISLQKKTKEKSAVARWGTLFIYLSSFLKIFAIFALGTNEFLIYIIALIAYLIVIHIHLKHSGYYLAETGSKFWKGFKYRVDKEFKEEVSDYIATLNNIQREDFLLQMASGSEQTSIFEVNEKFDDIEKNGHRISLQNSIENESGVVYQYKLTTAGLLLDSDLQHLLNGQPNTLKVAIAFACLEHQLNQTLIPELIEK